MFICGQERETAMFKLNDSTMHNALNTTCKGKNVVKISSHIFILALGELRAPSSELRAPSSRRKKSQNKKKKKNY